MPEPTLKELLYKTLFGKDGVMTVSDFINAFNVVVENLVAFKKELTTKVDTAISNIKDGHTPTDAELIALIKPLIPEPKKGEDGKTPTKQEILALLKPLIPKVKDGETPTDERLLKLIEKVAPTETGEETIKKINADKSKEVIKKEKVEGLADIEDMARTADANSRYSMRAAGDTIYLKDLSDQTDGVTKVFAIPVYRRAIMVTGSDFPSVLFPNNGFTIAPGVLTLTVATAPSAGSQLGLLYVI